MIKKCIRPKGKQKHHLYKNTHDIKTSGPKTDGLVINHIG
jgi:hypothetical protein